MWKCTKGQWIHSFVQFYKEVHFAQTCLWIAAGSVDGKNYYNSSSGNDNLCFEGYVNEPEYSKADLDSMNFNNVNDGSESES